MLLDSDLPAARDSEAAAAALNALVLKAEVTTRRGTSKFTTEAANNALMIPNAVTCPPIHSIVVVTSPIGDHAPPALAAITITETNSRRSSPRSSSFRISDTITMLVVRLSRTALNKNVTQDTIHNKLVIRLVRMRDVITAKPSWASIISTMVIAPSRKKVICAVAVILSSSSCPMRA